MKILLISNYSNDNQESMLRYSDMLSKNLKLHNQDVTVISAKPILGLLKKSNVGFGKWLGYVDKFIFFPLYLLFVKNRYDFVHICDHGNALYIKYLKDTPHCVTCHDVFGIKSGLGLNDKNKRGKSGALYQSMILNGLKRAQKVITVSQKTKDELMEISGIQDSNVKVIYNPLNFDYKVLKKEELETQLSTLDIAVSTQYIFHIGDDKWYKNRLGAIKMFEQVKESAEFFKLKFILAGKPFNDEVREYVKNSDYTSDIIKFDFVSNNQLEALYNGAKLLLFPSFAEGFGWPIIEAQTCGTPVVTSNRAPMTEVAENSGIYVNPDDPKEAAITIIDFLSNSMLQTERSVMGLENVKRFDPQVIIKQFINTYKELQK